MLDVVLVVESDPARRAAICLALARRSRPYVEASDLYQAIAAMGRADFGAMVVNESRPVSLRGACRLARKRHPAIRIFVSLATGVAAETVKATVGVTVDTVQGDLFPDEVAQVVDDALSLLQMADPETLNTMSVLLDVEAALALEDGAPAPPAEANRGDGVLLEGSLDDGNGAALLMGLYAQEATGVLHVSKGAAGGNLYFLRGEPIWFTHPQGDSVLLRRLKERGHLKPGVPVPPCGEGELLSTLAGEGLVAVDKIQETLLEMLRERVLALATQTNGVYKFTEDSEFANQAPILKLNVFGLVLDSRRRQMTADRVLVLGAEMARQYMVPGPGLKKAAPRIAHFTRGVRVDDFVDGTHTVQELYDATRLDQMMGALVMLVLVDTHLITLSAHPAGKSRSGVELADVAPPASWDTPDLPEVTMELDGEAAADAGAQQVLKLYFRLKPLTVPAQVLGIPMFSEPAQIEAAYWGRMKELEHRALPKGAAGSVMSFRIEDLRRKVTRAYQAMMATTGPMARPAPPAKPL